MDDYELTQLIVAVRKGAGPHEIDVDVVSVYECSSCGAIVREDRRAKHSGWHARQALHTGPFG